MSKLKNFLTKDNWAQGWWSLNRANQPCHWSSPKAEKFCLMGALHKIYDGDQYWEMQDRLASLIRVLHNQRIGDFNDSASWEDVQFVLRSIDI